MAEISNTQWRRLQQAIQRDRCVLVLGPDAAIDPNDPSGSSLTAQAAHHIAAQLRNPEVIAHPDNFPHVAQAYFAEQRSHLDLEGLVEEFYKPNAERVSAFHRSLARLPFSVILQISHDESFLHALIAQGKHPQRRWYHRGRPEEITEEPTPEQPLVYELFGSIRDPESLILTEEDRLDFLAKVLRSTPALPSKLISRFSAATTSFLFLGFGFSDWSARILLHALRPQPAGERSLAFEVPSKLCDPHHACAALFFDTVHAVEFPQADLLALAEHLADQLPVVPAVPETQVMLPAGAPRVFLCYTGEDRERVQDLEQYLTRQGIAIWRDKKSLRGGDNWRQLIPEIIEKQIDYFVVCASTELKKRKESYCFWEIKRALDRQDMQAHGLRFLIQGLLDPEAALANVPSELHHIALHEKPGLSQLVETIRNDWQRRQA